MPPPQANRTGERERPNGVEPSATGSPETIGRYRLMSKIAKGGMAEVYAARSYGAHGFEKTVALKRILPKFGRDPQFVRMMVDEAKISVLLNHPNIAQIFELGEQEGDYFIVMEFVPGQSLSAVVKRMKEDGVKLPVLDACFVVVELLQGLHAAHIQPDANGAAAHIIHRDVSPQNTLVSFDGHVKVIDFGIARARDRLEATEIGTIKGKLRYLAPEMIDPGRFTKEGDFDHRVDVFAAGIVLWELIAARPLFPGDDEMKVYDDITDGKTPDLVTENKCDAALMKIVARALERRLDKRYASAEAFADDLRAYVYRSDPSFTHKRISGVMAKLFPDEKAELLALERGGSSHSVANPKVPTPGSVGPSERPLPPTMPESHTRSDRNLPQGKQVPIDEAATAIADLGALDPLGQLPRHRDVTMMTLVSREHAAIGPSPSDSSGVFSTADDATLTVSADAVAALKDGLGIKPRSASIVPSEGTVDPTVEARAPMRPMGGPAIPASAPQRFDETPLTSRHPGVAPSGDGGRNRLVAASAIVGVILAVLIVAIVDRVTQPKPVPPPTATTTQLPPPDATTAPPSIAPAQRMAVTITAVQGALIVVGDLRGQSPLVVDAAVGDVLSVQVSAPGHKKASRSVTVEASDDGAMAVTVILEVEAVAVAAFVNPTDASVTIDGQPLTPQQVLPPDVDVKVEISSPGYVTEVQRLTPRAGVPLTITATLKRGQSKPRPAPPPPAVAPRGTGTLTIKTTPLWGKVTVDGKAYDDTTPLTITLPAGRHDVVVSHPPRNLVKRLRVTIGVDEKVVQTVTFEDN